MRGPLTGLSRPHLENRPRCLSILEDRNRGDVKDAPRHTIRRRLDEPKLELGATISLKDGTTGVVLARYIPSGRSDEVCYTVEVISEVGKKEHRDHA